jgi:hypothetical protein
MKIEVVVKFYVEVPAVTAEEAAREYVRYRIDDGYETGEHIFDWVFVSTQPVNKFSDGVVEKQWRDFQDWHAE